MKNLLATFTLLTAGSLAGCMGMAAEDVGSQAAALEESSSELCGQDGRTTYALTCDELMRACQGTFTCYDETPSRDGSCLTWGECVYTTSAGIEPDEIDYDGSDDGDTENAGLEPDEIDYDGNDDDGRENAGLEPDEIDAR